jgi:hypothetical protein
MDDNVNLKNYQKSEVSKIEWKTYNEWNNYVKQNSNIPKVKATTIMNNEGINQIPRKCSIVVCKSFVARLTGCQKYC